VGVVGGSGDVVEAVFTGWGFFGFDCACLVVFVFF